MSKSLMIAAAMLAIAAAATPVHAANGFNDISMNGQGSQGISMNGLGTQGISMNGLGANGITRNGIFQNGTQFQGRSATGIAVQDMAADRSSFVGITLQDGRTAAAR